MIQGIFHPFNIYLFIQTYFRTSHSGTHHGNGKVHSLYILRHLQSDTTNSRLERVHKNHSYNLHNLTLCTEY